jgi:hypothetical protein
VRALVLVFAVAACRPATPKAPAPEPEPGPANQLSGLPVGPATAVARLAPNVATAVVAGPFLITAINPGGSLELAVRHDARCDDPDVVWFEYSGAGTAVGAGQVLCARSSASKTRTQAFSGRSP